MICSWLHWVCAVNLCTCDISFIPPANPLFSWPLQELDCIALKMLNFDSLHIYLFCSKMVQSNMVEWDALLSITQKPAEEKGKGIEDSFYIKSISFILVHVTVFLSPRESIPLQDCDGLTQSPGLGRNVKVIYFVLNTTLHGIWDSYILQLVTQHVCLVLAFNWHTKYGVIITLEPGGRFRPLEIFTSCDSRNLMVSSEHGEKYPGFER